jgi:hypothetical protein
VASIASQWSVGSSVWPAHPQLFAFVATVICTIVSQHIWSPEYFKRRASASMVAPMPAASADPEWPDQAARMVE